MTLDSKLDLQAVLDGLGQGILIFDSDGKLIFDNLAARTVLGTDRNVIHSEGWSAVSVLFNTGVNNPDENIDSIREKALKAERPVRFHIYRSGQYVPCWAAAVTGEDGVVHTMITLDAPDWYLLTDVISYFRKEMKEAVDTAKGHVDIIDATIERYKTEDGETLGKRINNFTRLINIHMQRTGYLMEMLERLENIRTGAITDIVRERHRKVDIAEYFEDFIEELDEIQLVDPETEAQDHRSRITTDITDGLYAHVSTRYLTRILHDMLRNAIMYSMKATPIKIGVTRKGNRIQVAITDDGYGVRESETEQIFAPFKRARQPQIISEFGYGLSLYLCKHEIEAMGGQLWFTSEENVGSTFYLSLPEWRDDTDSSSSSSDSSAKTEP